MTIGAAWLRTTASGDELWLATDSRLSGDGYLWDSCPKLMVMPRPGMCAAFAGATSRAYPLLLQAAEAIGSYRPAASGTMEWHYLVAHLERVVTSMMVSLSVDPLTNNHPEGRLEFASLNDTLVIGGFSRASGALQIRVLRYQHHLGRWCFSRVTPLAKVGPSRTIAIFGDRRARGRFGFMLSRRLEVERKLGDKNSFELEPLEVLAEMLRMPAEYLQQHSMPLDRRPRTTGGAPQVVRILPAATPTSFVVAWPTEDDPRARFLRGRRLLDYENVDVPMLSFPGGTVRVTRPDASRGDVDPASPGDDALTTTLLSLDD